MAKAKRGSGARSKKLPGQVAGKGMTNRDMLAPQMTGSVKSGANMMPKMSGRGRGK